MSAAGRAADFSRGAGAAQRPSRRFRQMRTTSSTASAARVPARRALLCPIAVVSHRPPPYDGLSLQGIPAASRGNRVVPEEHHVQEASDERHRRPAVVARSGAGKAGEIGRQVAHGDKGRQERDGARTDVDAAFPLPGERETQRERTMDRTKIRAVVFQDGGMWAGRCLEYDIGAQADSLEKLDRYLEIAIAATRRESRERSGKEFAGVPPAPEHFRKLWERRAGDFTPQGVSPDRNVTLALCA